MRVEVIIATVEVVAVLGSMVVVDLKVSVYVYDLAVLVAWIFSVLLLSSQVVCFSGRTSNLVGYSRPCSSKRCVGEQRIYPSGPFAVA